MKFKFLVVALAVLTTISSPLLAAGATVSRNIALPSGSLGLYQGYLPLLACSSSSSCTVGGVELNSRNIQEAFVASEQNGAWTPSKALTPPNGYKSSQGVTLTTLQCPSLGSCSATGQFGTATGQYPFTVSEVHGVWQGGSRLALPANAATSSQFASPHAEWCASAGNCVTVGTYIDSAGNSQVFVAFQTKGRWGVAHELALPKNANIDPHASLTQLACRTTGDCVAVGSYTTSDSSTQALVLPEVRGRWQRGFPLSLPANASGFSGASASELTCSATTCTLVGSYLTYGGALEPMVAQGWGTGWDRAVGLQLPSNAARNPQTLFYGFSGGVSCDSSETCALGGQYLDNTGHYQGFLAVGLKGRWGATTELVLPSGAQQAGHNGGVVSVSCVQSVCHAGAAYIDSTGQYQAYIVTRTSSGWHTGITVALPGGASSVGVDGGLYSIECSTASTCLATGSYLTTPIDYGGFVVTLP
ncbi:MAG: hypothetical protein KGR42_06175 [Acidobacteria bacterium]|nr:hypothetical protein [Acidobacteriota bacterium]